MLDTLSGVQISISVLRREVKMPSVLWCCWLGGRKGIWPVKKTEWWGSGMVICLERVADLHMAQLMPLPLTVSCFSKIQIVFTFLVLADPGSPGQRAIKGVSVCLWREVKAHYCQSDKFLIVYSSALTLIVGVRKDIWPAQNPFS